MNVKIMAADRSATNNTGSQWAAALQVSDGPAHLFKLSFSPCAGMANDVYAWIFDTAAGSGASAAPVGVRLIPAGVADTWDFGAGGVWFPSGIYLRLATAAPTDPTTDTSALSAGANKVIIKADYRKAVI